jgi:hypothetical protein
VASRLLNIDIAAFRIGPAVIGRASFVPDGSMFRKDLYLP